MLAANEFRCSSEGFARASHWHDLQLHNCIEELRNDRAEGEREKERREGETEREKGERERRGKE